MRTDGEKMDFKGREPVIDKAHQAKRLTGFLCHPGVFSLGMGLLGGFFPAWRAARLKIVNALREI